MDTVTIAHPRTHDTRELRALQLVQAHGKAIERVHRDVYLVPSQDGLRSYRVEYGDLGEGKFPELRKEGSKDSPCGGCAPLSTNPILGEL